jgi:hypothetical protein
MANPPDTDQTKNASQEREVSRAVLDSISLAAVSDRPAIDDTLGFGPYVDALAKFLASPNTVPPLTVSIEGPWGSGKSSFMKLLQDALWRVQGRRPLLVTFNAWRHDKDEALWASFATSFSDQLAEQQSWWRCTLGRLGLAWRKLQKAGFLPLFAWVALMLFATFLAVEAYRHARSHPPEVAEFVSKTENVQQVLTWIGPLGALVAVILTTLQQAFKVLGDPLKTNLRKYLRRPDYASRQAFIEIFHEDFTRTVDAFAGGERIFVFIDDLDRCDVPRAADLMQALTLLIADDRRIVFILGMDREKVAAGIAYKFRELAPYLNRRPGLEGEKASLDYGYQFLEKFVQISFPLPHPSATALERFVGSLGTIGVPLPKSSWLVRQWHSCRTLFLGSRWQRKRDLDESVSSLESPKVEGEKPSTSADATKRTFRFLGFEADSDRIRRIVQGVAPTLGNNPRRLKQFLNLFRLRTYIALETGLFDDVGERRGISLEHLGKIAALSMRWPEFIDDWMLSPGAMAEFERSQSVPEAWKRWASTPALQSLILSDLGAKKGEAALSAVPVEDLFRVSPAVPRPVDSRVDDTKSHDSQSEAVLLNDELIKLARQYEIIRAEQTVPSNSRTRAMHKVADQMSDAGAGWTIDGRRAAEQFSHMADGERLAIIVMLRSAGRWAAQIAAEAIKTRRSAFEQFKALEAVNSMSRQFGRADGALLVDAIRAAPGEIWEDSSRANPAQQLLELFDSDAKARSSIS